MGFFGLTDKGRMVDTPYRVGRAAGSLIYLTITKDNSDPMYDPANDLEMEMMPWQEIEEKVNDYKSYMEDLKAERERIKAERAAAEAAAAEAAAQEAAAQ